MGKPMVKFCMCGTREKWEYARKLGRYKDMNHVIPGAIYVSDTGLALITSQEWVDWLTGETAELPVCDSTEEMSK